MTTMNKRGRGKGRNQEKKEGGKGHVMIIRNETFVENISDIWLDVASHLGLV